jgi:hypothetical protein
LRGGHLIRTGYSRVALRIPRGLKPRLLGRRRNIAFWGFLTITTFSAIRVIGSSDFGRTKGTFGIYELGMIISFSFALWSWSDQLEVF